MVAQRCHPRDQGARVAPRVRAHTRRARSRPRSGMTPRPLRLVISDHAFSQLSNLRGPISIPVYAFLDSAAFWSSCSSSPRKHWLQCPPIPLAESVFRLNAICLRGRAVPHENETARPPPLDSAGDSMYQHTRERSVLHNLLVLSEVERGCDTRSTDHLHEC